MNTGSLIVHPEVSCQGDLWGPFLEKFCCPDNHLIGGKGAICCGESLHSPPGWLLPDRKAPSQASPTHLSLVNLEQSGEICNLLPQLGNLSLTTSGEYPPPPPPPRLLHSSRVSPEDCTELGLFSHSRTWEGSWQRRLSLPSHQSAHWWHGGGLLPELEPP